MGRLVAAELLKLRTTRTFYGLTAGALVLVGLISAGAAAAGTFEAGDTPGSDLLGIATLAQVFALVLGILAVSTEFRHGTITPSLLTVPSRTRLVVAKLIANLLAGTLLGLAAFLLCAVIVAVALSLRDLEFGLDGADVAATVVGGTAGSALYAALGVGLGALVRNQVGAVVGALGFVFVLEPLVGIIPGIADAVGKYGLNGVANGISSTSDNQTTDVLAQVPAGLLFAAYAAIFLVLGTLALKRRDVTA